MYVRQWRRKTKAAIPFNFYMVYFREEKKKTLEQSVISLTLFS